MARADVSGSLAADQVDGYLSARLGASVEVMKLRQSYPGFSRQTWLIEARVGGAHERLVLRIDPPWGASVPFTLEQEWMVYQRLWRSEVPVGEPLWYDCGQDFAGGRPLMVRRLVEGSSTVPGLTERTVAGADLRQRIVGEHFRALATLHRLDWRALGFDTFLPVPPSPAEALRFEYDWWVSRWRERRSEAFVVITEFLCWLRELIPSDTPRISLVKGNNGVGEEIFHDSRLVAMSDFELTSLGDGALDLGFSQGTLELLPPGEAIRIYEEAMGERISPERLAFSTIWIRFKSVANVNGEAFWNQRHRGDFRTTCAALGFVHAKASEAALAPCIGKDLLTAANLLASRSSSYVELES